MTTDLNNAGTEWLTTSQVAQLTQTSKSYWEKARVRGDGPPYSTIGIRVRYRTPDVAAWIAARRVTSTSEGGAK